MLGRTEPRRWRSIAALSVLAVAAQLAGTVAAQGGPPEVWLDPVVERAPVVAGSTVRVALQVTLPEGYHVNSEEPLDEFLIPTTWVLDPPEGMSAGRIAFPPAQRFLQGDVLELVVFETEFAIGAEIVIDRTLAPGIYTVGTTFGYQACDEFACYAPTTADVPLQIDVAASGAAAGVATHGDLFVAMTFRDADAPALPTRALPAPDAADGSPQEVLAALERFAVAGTAGGYMGEEPFLEFIDAAESGRQEEGWFANRGPLAIVALILIGGLALNLTPCVLPMIPINLAIIGAGSQAGSRARGFALGGAYGLAMAVVYGVLGLVVILTAGTFGTINASPWFNLGIAALFVVLGLAMFDVVQIDFSRFQTVQSSEGSRGTLLLAFGMGGVAALLAGACVAPVVIQVIVFSSNLYATGMGSALALPFLLGVGMALPWPIAGAGLSLLPKPGVWMVRVKQAFGVFILATAAYYGWIGYGLVAQRWVDPDEVLASVAELAEEGWHTSLLAALQEAEADNKLLLVDVWATWCKNCVTMDKTTLKEPAVEAALEDYVKVKFRAEDLNASPATEVMKRLGAIGLPTYGILAPASRAAAAAGLETADPPGDDEPSS